MVSSRRPAFRRAFREDSSIVPRVFNGLKPEELVRAAPNPAQGSRLYSVNSLDIVSVRALMRALGGIDSTMDLQARPKIFLPSYQNSCQVRYYRSINSISKTGVAISFTSVEGLFTREMKGRVLITQREFRNTPHYRETMLPLTACDSNSTRLAALTQGMTG